MLYCLTICKIGIGGREKMSYIKYGNTDIYYSLYRQERKDVRIVIDLVNGVVVYTPKKTPDEKIHNLLSSKTRWIYNKFKS